MKKLTCIICPRGCNICIEKKDEEFYIEGNKCIKGKDFAINELINPMRSVTSTVKTIFNDFPRLPVKTDGEVSVSKIFEVMNELDEVIIKSPVKTGAIIIENILNTGVNIVATADMSLYIRGGH